MLTHPTRHRAQLFSSGNFHCGTGHVDGTRRAVIFAAGEGAALTLSKVLKQPHAVKSHSGADKLKPGGSKLCDKALVVPCSLKREIVDDWMDPEKVSRVLCPSTVCNNPERLVDAIMNGEYK